MHWYLFEQSTDKEDNSQYYPDIMSVTVKRLKNNDKVLGELKVLDNF